MKAILSDIHGNLEAMEAVLTDIAAHDVSEIICLGDIATTGPDPIACLDHAMQFDLTLLGDHDVAIMGQEIHSNPAFHDALVWARRQMATGKQKRSRRYREFLASLPLTYTDGDFLFLHGGPRDPVHEYLFPEDIYNQKKMADVFCHVERYCFAGHTHLPGIFTETFAFLIPDEFDNRWEVDRRKIICNVGSVGQPRDGDSRACYVLLEGNVITFRRVEYDLGETMRKLRDRGW